MTDKKQQVVNEQSDIETSLNEENRIETPAVTCEDQLVEAKKELEHMRQLYLRALADYKNQEQRVRQERIQMRDILREQFVGELLPILDHLDTAEAFTKDPGLQMIAKMMRDTLKTMGLEQVELLNKVYDPHEAEVIEVIEGEKDDVIIAVLQKAYKMHGHVIRPGTVKVSRKKN